MSKTSKIPVIINVVLAAVLVAAGSWFFLKYRTERSDLGKKYAAAIKELEDFKKNPQAAALAEQDRIIAEVSKVYALPKDERPSQIAAVDADQAKLDALKKAQPFFAKAEQGDIALIYTNAKLAVLYRPKTQQLINVASVSIEENKTTQTPTP